MKYHNSVIFKKLGPKPNKSPTHQVKRSCWVTLPPVPSRTNLWKEEQTRIKLNKTRAENEIDQVKPRSRLTNHWELNRSAAQATEQMNTKLLSRVKQEAPFSKTWFILWELASAICNTEFDQPPRHGKIRRWEPVKSNEGRKNTC